MSDRDILIGVIVAGVVAFVVWIFLIAPVLDYLNERREYKRREWVGKWSEYRRLEILRYKRDQAVKSVSFVAGMANLGVMGILLLNIFMGNNGLLGWLVACVVFQIVTYRVLYHADRGDD